MGLVQSTISRALSEARTVGEIHDPELSAYELSEAIEKDDADAVLRVLNESGYDAIAHDVDGYTMLQRAVSRGNSQIVEILLQHAGNDPAIVNAKDSRGFTPLVFAAMAKNVPVMQILLKAGARVDDADVEKLLDHADPRVHCHGSSVAAEMLVRAKGNISEAFTLSVRYGAGQGAELYFSAGASSLHALSLGSEAIKRMSNWHCVRAEDVLTRLEQVQRSGDADANRPLLSAEMAFRTIYGMTGQSDEAIAAVYQGFVAAGADAEQLVSFAVREYAIFERREDFSRELNLSTPRSDYFHVLRSLIAIGAPTTHEVIKRSQTDSKQVMESLVRLGADVLGAMPKLNESNARSLAYVALKTVLQQHGLSEEQKAEKLNAIIASGGASGAADLACDLTKDARSLDDVKRLLMGGATISDTLLLAVADRACHAEPGRPHAQTARRAPEYQLLRQLIDARVNDSSIESARDSRNAICNAIGERYGDLASQEALNMLMYAQLQSLLSQSLLSSEQKVVIVKEMRTQYANSAAEELLRDAVIGQHSATMKLLVLADVPATEAFLALSRMLYDGKVAGTKSKTEALVRHGADAEPAVAQLVENIKNYTAAGEVDRAQIEQGALIELRLAIASAIQSPAVR